MRWRTDTPRTASPHLPSIRHNLEFSSRLKQVGRNITGHGFSNPWTTTDRNVRAPGFEAPFTAFRRMATRGEDAAFTLAQVVGRVRSLAFPGRTASPSTSSTPGRPLCPQSPPCPLASNQCLGQAAQLDKVCDKATFGSLAA